MFNNFFKIFKPKSKPIAVRFGELSATFTFNSDTSDNLIAQYSVIFFEYEDGKREYTVKGSYVQYFNKTTYFLHCETWKYTGLFPEWAKDPLAEKLCRDN